MNNKKGFALATTLIVLAISVISTSMLVSMLARSIKLTRSHNDAIKAFYVADAGKSFAMWKLSSLNSGDDATQLANCMAQNEDCPGGLNSSWSYSLPGATDSTFEVTVTSDGQAAGSAQIDAFGEVQTAKWLARRRAKIDAFRPLRMLEDNDQAFDYAINIDNDFWTLFRGYTKITSAEEPERASIHANGNISQFLQNTLELDGNAKASDVVLMPSGLLGNTFTAAQFRGSSCGFSGCSSMYNNYPQHCFGTGCDGYVGDLAMPGLDINSARSDSFKTVAREIEDTTGQKMIYTAQEISSALEAARVSGANGGWYETPGPITYVNGQLTIDYGQKLKVHGVLVVQGKMSIGIPKRFPLWQCLLISCVPSSSLVIDDQVVGQNGAVTGLVATGDIEVSLYVDEFDINGLIYSLKGIYFVALENPVTTRGVIVARDYLSSDFYIEGVPMHHHIYDSSKLHLLVQGPRALTDITTVYTGHWEEEY